jgi:hypothetical protein
MTKDDRELTVGEAVSAIASYCREMENGGKEPKFSDLPDALRTAAATRLEALQAQPVGECALHPLAQMVAMDEEIEAEHHGWMTGQPVEGAESSEAKSRKALEAVVIAALAKAEICLTHIREARQYGGRSLAYMEASDALKHVAEAHDAFNAILAEGLAQSLADMRDTCAAIADDHAETHAKARAMAFAVGDRQTAWEYDAKRLSALAIAADIKALATLTKGARDAG